MDLPALKQRACAAIDADREALIELSLRIHANPEVAYCEEKASVWLGDYLARRSFNVERAVADMPTAFRATAGTGSPIVAILAEYDALPGIGHGCGHNVIAASA